MFFSLLYQRAFHVMVSLWFWLSIRWDPPLIRWDRLLIRWYRLLIRWYQLRPSVTIRTRNAIVSSKMGFVFVFQEHIILALTIAFLVLIATEGHSLLYQRAFHVLVTNRDRFDFCHAAFTCPDLGRCLPFSLRSATFELVRRKYYVHTQVIDCTCCI